MDFVLLLLIIIIYGIVGRLIYLFNEGSSTEEDLFPFAMSWIISVPIWLISKFSIYIFTKLRGE